MIIQNGTIEFKTKTAGGIDPETGYPVKPSSVAWGEPVPCQFKAKKFNQLGIIKGEHFTVASYEILIEEPIHRNLFGLRRKINHTKTV